MKQTEKKLIKLEKALPQAILQLNMSIKKIRNKIEDTRKEIANYISAGLLLLLLLRLLFN